MIDANYSEVNTAELVGGFDKWCCSQELYIEDKLDKM